MTMLGFSCKFELHSTQKEKKLLCQQVGLSGANLSFQTIGEQYVMSRDCPFHRMFRTSQRVCLVFAFLSVDVIGSVATSQGQGWLGQTTRKFLHWFI